MAAVSRLTRKLSEERASVLATEAVTLAKSGKLEVTNPTPPNVIAKWS